MIVPVADRADYDTGNSAYLHRWAGMPLASQTTIHVVASCRQPVIEIDAGGCLTDSDMNPRNGS